MQACNHPGLTITEVRRGRHQDPAVRMDSATPYESPRRLLLRGGVEDDVQERRAREGRSECVREGAAAGHFGEGVQRRGCRHGKAREMAIMWAISSSSSDSVVENTCRQGSRGISSRWASRFGGHQARGIDPRGVHAAAAERQDLCVFGLL